MLSSLIRPSRFVAAAAIALFARFAPADVTQVVPPTSATVAGDANNLIPIGASPGGTYSVLYGPDQLAGLPIGSTINSIQMRLRNAEAVAWPPAPVNITTYEIRFGQSDLTPATISNTFANNIKNSVLVRGGALALATGAYPAGAATGTTPEAWGPVITFTTPFVYTGGVLAIEFRNTGATGGSVYGDANVNSAGGAGVGSISSSTTGGAAGAIIVRLGFSRPDDQSLTVPPANANVAGTTGNYIPLGAVAGGRYLVLYDTAQLAAIPAGSVISGLQMRLWNAHSANWPNAATAITSYQIYLAQSPRTPATISTTFAANLTNPVLVRDGALDLAAGTYPAGANTGAVPEGWGPMIEFQTPFVYKGGVLAIDFHNTGGGAPTNYADGILSGATAAGIGDINSPSATVGVDGGAVIIRLLVTPPVTSPFGPGVTKVFALNKYADTPASNYQNTVLYISGYATEFVYAPAQFQTIGPGSLFTGLAYRNDNITAWPLALTNVGSYDIQLGKSVNGPATLSTTVANNLGADATTVRSGALAIPAGAMAAAPTTGTAPYTFEIPFTTSYPYVGGSLINVVRQSGTGSDGHVDAIFYTDPENGVDTKGYFGDPQGTASTPNAANVPVVRYSADAQVIVPNAVANGVGLGGNYIFASPFATSASTIQFILGASQLSYIPFGGLLNSVSFLAESGAWPGAAGAAADDLSVTVSTAKLHPADASNTFAANEGDDAMVVRSGPISWLPGALPAASTNRFGGTITFDRAFVYTGGDLCITIRKSGVVGGNPSLRAANPVTVTRVIRLDGTSNALAGEFFGLDGGAAIQVGYIPSGTSPKRCVTTPETNNRALTLTRRLQMLFNPEAVGVPVGATINGFTWRLAPNATVDVPSADVSYTRFDAWMSTSPRTAQTASTTFATNEGADLVQVRSGALTIPALAWHATSSNPEEWGAFVQFSRPFVYKGGTLSFSIRCNTASGPVGEINLEAGTDLNPVIDCQAVRNSTDPDALTGSLIKPPTTQFAFTARAFCPCDLNNDGIVFDDDFVIFLNAYNILDCVDAGMPPGCLSDFNFDGVVDDDDFVIFLAAYNALLCP